MKKMIELGEGDFILYDNIVVDSPKGKIFMPPFSLIIGGNSVSE